MLKLCNSALGSDPLVSTEYATSLEFEAICPHHCTDSVPRKVASRRRKRLSTEVWCYDKAFTLFWKSKASPTCAAL